MNCSGFCNESSAVWIKVHTNSRKVSRQDLLAPRLSFASHSSINQTWLRPRAHYCKLQLCFVIFISSETHDHCGISEINIRNAIWHKFFFFFLARGKRRHDGVQTFKLAQRDTSTGLFHASGILAFLVNSFKSLARPSLTDTF